MSGNRSGMGSETNEPFAALFDMQRKISREILSQFGGQTNSSLDSAGLMPNTEDLAQWTASATQLQTLWMSFLQEKGSKNTAPDPAQWMLLTQTLAKQIPQSPMEMGQKMARDTMDIWQSVFSQFANTTETTSDNGGKDLPRKDRRFSDPAWKSHPGFVLLHQTYLMLAEYMANAVKQIDGLDKGKKQQLEFATQALLDAMSPDNFIATNPVVMQRTMETKGQNLVRGLTHFITDLKRGQLTHSDPNAFTLGKNLAVTPGKVVHETPLYQLIQYTPTTEHVLDVPLVIFPPWINRFYILDLTPKKSFIKWAVDAGLTVFVVSWKSADSSMKDVVWDDYITSQISAIGHICERLKVPHVHTIGYCVAGTTLAATLAVLDRRGDADKVKSATFFTAQVDFERSGELRTLINSGHLDLIDQMSGDGYLDGRYLAATFNALRSKDLIWNYVVNNYLLGEDYPAFDLLHWNGDVTNLPSAWHGAYLRDLYRDNKLIVADALIADGTPIDLSRIKTPTFLQAGRDDHIAPAESVWQATQHFSGPVDFLLAGSGHIAGVVNPPSSGKYQYWTGDSSAETMAEFIENALEHPGSWWPHWLEWLHQQDDAKSTVKGKRKPGGKNDSAIEDAPGRYVMTR